eukprot:m.460823 g.460823  ORF g.460823 m.460823 type:complete len:290 (+) comp21599_c0_seq10:192-1061(+)
MDMLKHHEKSKNENSAMLQAAVSNTDVAIAWFSPVWILVVAAVVVTGHYETWTGTSYLICGIVLSVPCILLPASACRRVDTHQKFWERYYVRFTIWMAIVVFIASYFFTHYFYTLLGVRYTLPTDGWELNHVPISMYLMAYPYFCTYHTLAAYVLRRSGDNVTGLPYAVVVVAIAYVTAVLEAVGMAAFPHYTYPDAQAMFVKGSAFYSLLFVITYPMFHEFQTNYVKSGGARMWTIWETCQHALAACMLALLLMEGWRLCIGTISPLVDSNPCPPFTHPLKDGILKPA